MKKNILIVDDSQKTINLLNLLLEEYTDFNTIVEKDYQKIINSYTNDKYEFIIIEHNCHKANELVNFVCTTNPQQKVILLSDSINCPIDCNTCLASLKFVRLLKPIDPKSILFYIESNNEFSCPNKHRFDKIDTIEKLYDFINLSENIFFTQKVIEDDKLIISSKLQSALDFNEMEKIKSNINENYFDVNVLDSMIIVTNK